MHFGSQAQSFFSSDDLECPQRLRGRAWRRENLSGPRGSPASCPTLSGSHRFLPMLKRDLCRRCLHLSCSRRSAPPPQKKCRLLCKISSRCGCGLLSERPHLSPAPHPGTDPGTCPSPAAITRCSQKVSFQSPPPSTHNPSGCRTGSILKVGSHSPTGLCLGTFWSLPKGWSAAGGRGTRTGAEPKPPTWLPSPNLGMGAGVG